VEGLEAAYRRGYRRLVGLACLLTGSREVAEDLVQDTFVRCADRIDALEDPDTYLRAAVANTCRSWHRRQGIARRLARTDRADRPDAHVPEALVEFHDALLALKPEQRTAVVLRVYGGFSADEIAELTETNASTVRSRLQRGLAALRKVVPRD
jgi:RNA polymerase sigma-70 factor, ECF subfamily